jgi:hypothetical protein
LLALAEVPVWLDGVWVAVEEDDGLDGVWLADDWLDGVVAVDEEDDGVDADWLADDWLDGVWADDPLSVVELCCAFALVTTATSPAAATPMRSVLIAYLL